VIHQSGVSRWHARVIGAVVAIYTRVSSEDTEHPSSTRRQEFACREFADDRGWDVADVYEDVDVSAYDRKVSAGI
jgi:DNA invertase Pin-like site-specific DNA recombinase